MARTADAVHGPAGRGLALGGMLQLVLGSVSGAAVMLMDNPRLGLSAHLGGVAQGIAMMVLGLVWTRVALAARSVHVERLGYFVADRFEHRPERPACNRVVALRDSWARIEARPEEQGSSGLQLP